GQFVMVHCSVEGLDPMFARAFSYYKVDGDRFALLYTVVGRGTRWLSERGRGDQVRMYGPLGRGLRLPAGSGNLLLIGGGVGIAPLVDTAERAVAKGHQVVAMMGARTDRHLLAASEWPREVEYVVVTEDGSAGGKGLVTQHLGKYQEWASKIYACGPTPMFQGLADVLRQSGRRQRPEILMEENMPCGWGMCYGCAIFTRHGVRLCCKDGPRFNLFDVY
ncbi:MAG: dihydroorotate dehydrogenase electron transfer subunit, partial [Dehalococcoidia bacterium]|nr:dihydroorotate dehydrogenase electron transfer subunit [Dehalococcoidia bacterium]